ncbi:MAG: putative ABC transporter permease subunit [Bacteroidota bacterium]
MTSLETSAGLQPRSLWSYVSKLLHLQWVIFATGFKRAAWRRKLTTILIVLLALAGFAGSLLLTRSIIRLLDSPLGQESGIDLGSLISDLPALVLSAAFLGILLTSFGLLLQALYLANDMDFLLSAPIPIRAVFLTKLLQAILPNFILILLFGLPVLFGLGAAGGYSLLYFPLVLLVLAFLALAAAGLSGLLVMAAVRILPAKRVAEVLAFIGTVLAILFSQWSNLAGSNTEGLTSEQFSRGAGAVSALNSAWSPLALAARGLVDLGEGRWFSGILLLTLTIALFGGVFWFALNAAERLYYTGWASMQVETRRKKTVRAVDRPEKTAAGANVLWRLLPSQVRAILLKDWLELRRDLRNLAGLVMPLIMGIVFTIMLLRGGGEPPAGRGEAPALFMDAFRAVIAYGNMAVSLFVGWSLLSRLALMSFSMESRSYWLIKSSPVSTSRLLAAKFFFAYLPALALSWLFLLGIGLLQRVPFTTMIYGLSSVALILAGLDGINLALGVRFADFSWTDPRRMAGGASGCLGMIASLAYLLVTLLLFFVPPIGAALLGIPELVGQVAGFLAGGTTALLCAVLPLRVVEVRIPRLAEE